MNKSELLKQLGYSEDFVNSLSKYEDAKKVNINININQESVQFYKLEFNSIDLTSYEFNEKTNDCNNLTMSSKII